MDRLQASGPAERTVVGTEESAAVSHQRARRVWFSVQTFWSVGRPMYLPEAHRRFTMGWKVPAGGNGGAGGVAGGMGGGAGGIGGADARNRCASSPPAASPPPAESPQAIRSGWWLSCFRVSHRVGGSRVSGCDVYARTRILSAELSCCLKSHKATSRLGHSKRGGFAVVVRGVQSECLPKDWRFRGRGESSTVM
eukprot:1186336-Prorocentrum_minimum.AAC.2